VGVRVPPFAPMIFFQDPLTLPSLKVRGCSGFRLAAQTPLIAPQLRIWRRKYNSFNVSLASICQGRLLRTLTIRCGFGRTAGRYQQEDSQISHGMATLLGHLAVSERFRGQGLGERLLMDALHRALKSSKQIASAAVVVDAKGDQAVAL
jgi:GNAT superfamily N-acetyltransferase